MNRDFWIKRWKQDKVFVLDKDRLKEKCFIFSPFPKTNSYGFQKGNVRPILSADVLARFERMCGKNVLFPTGYHSLCNTSFLENKKYSNVLNDDISNLFENEMLRLGIGINDKKNIDMRHNPYMCNLQQAFLDLYKRGYITYKDYRVYLDKKKNKIYDPCMYSLNLPMIQQNCFVLQLDRILPNILEEIQNLSVPQEIKNEYINVFKPKKILNLTATVSNGAKIKFSMDEPQYMGGISFIYLNPDYIDLNEYVDINEFQSVCRYLENNSEEAISAFSGLYAINPLTAYKIPIFISTMFSQEVYLGIPCIDEEDLVLSDVMELEALQILSDGSLIHSDFLDGLTPSDAKMTIMNAFINAELAVEETVYENTEILLSSLDNFGPLFPFLEDKEDGKIYSLEGHLPYSFSSKLRPTLADNVEIVGNTMNGTMNNMFTEGMAPMICMLYDEIGSIIPIFSKECINEIAQWKGIEYISLSKDNSISSILMPIIFYKIIEFEAQKLLPRLFHTIDFYEDTVDISYKPFVRSNNNLLDFEKILEEYHPDAIRLFFMNAAPKEAFVFNLYELKDVQTKILNLEKLLAVFSIENSKTDYALFNLIKDVRTALDSKDVKKYVELMLEFCNSFVLPNGLTKKQILIFIKLLYPICPFLVEDIYQNVFNGKYSIMNEDWPEE